MNTVGVLGGLGPETTAHFYLNVISKCYQMTQEQRPPILIWSIPLKYKIEEEILEKDIGEERYLPYLIEGARILEKAGADFVVIPCNTVHIFIEEIRNAVRIPVLSIVEETARFLKKRGISRTGILATTKTLDKDIYGKILDEYNIIWFKPEEKKQAGMGKIIHNILLRKYISKDKNKLLEVIRYFEKQGLKDVILACTDLHILITPEDSPMMIHDTMDILSEAAVREIVKNRVS